MSIVAQITLGFELQHCIECGIRFQVPHGFTDQRRQDTRAFYCPNGHSMSYRESTLDKVTRERDRLAQQIAQKNDEIADERRRREAQERSTIALRGHLTKARNRAKNGVCPCCTRTFGDLARHMKTKHPEFAADAVDPTGAAA